LGQAVGERVRQAQRDLDVQVIEGGQPHYPLLLGVE
jgi:hypothetical protein